MNRCGYSATPDDVCGATPSVHLLVNPLDGRAPRALFTCPEHLARARTAGLVHGEHDYGASCAYSPYSRWIFLKGGRTICMPAPARSAA